MARVNLIERYPDGRDVDPDRLMAAFLGGGIKEPMPDVLPSERIWSAVNKAIQGEDMGPVLATVIGGFTQLIMEGCELTEDQARAHLAAICLSPSGRPIGSLEPMLATEIERMRQE